MKRRMVAKLTALVMAVGMLPSPLAHAAEISANDFGAGDGVNFERIANGNVYYGNYEHVLQVGGYNFFYYGDVTGREEAKTPVLWQAMGEEKDENGQGDGNLTLMSNNALESMYLNEDTSDKSNDYSQSYLAQWLNDEENGFISDAFSSSEAAALATANVESVQYDSNGDEVSGTKTTAAQKVYIPAGKNTNTSDIKPTVYWSAKSYGDDNFISDTAPGQAVSLKGLQTNMFYWLRTPGTTGRIKIVRRGTDSPIVTEQSLNGAKYGVRPITKIDKDSVVFASKIVADPTDYTETASVAPHLAAADDGAAPNYKLTVLANDNGENPYSMNVSGYTDGEIIPVEMGDTVDLDFDTLSNYGEDYTVNYKAVMTLNGKRTIVDGGKTDATASSVSLSVPTSDFIRTEAEYDSVDLYVWLQKNNDYTSNEASEPMHFELQVTGGEVSVLPTPEPEALPSEVMDTIKLSYPDGKKKAAILSFDDLADFHVFSDMHLDEIFDNYGIVAAYNVITGSITENGATLQHFNEFDGHEMASHTVTHPHMDEITTEEFISELEDSKEYIENLTGEECAGLAYPFYYTADVEHLQYIKDAGYRYSRRTDPSNSFDIPNSFFNWNPTMHVLWNGGVSGGPYVLPTRTQDFVDLNTDEEKVMFIWGHSTDFGQFDENAANYSADTDTWYLIDDFCKAISDNFDTIWNPTVIEFVDYVNAQKLLGIYKGSDNNILFDNTKSNKNVWVTVSGTPVEIAAGQSMEVDPSDLGDIPTPAPTAVPTAAPTDAPTATPTVVPTDAPTEAPTQAPSATTAPSVPSGSEVIMVNTFDGNEAVNSTSTGTGTVSKVPSPAGASYLKIPTAQKNDTDSITANLEAVAALQDESSSNTVLKMSQQAASDTNTVTVYEGKLPKDFAFDFSILGVDSYANTRITVSQNNVSYNLIRFDAWTSSYLTDSRTRFTTNSADVWSPHTMIFKDFATANTKLDMYHLGRLNYTGAATNPQTYTNASFDLGDFYSAIDLTQDVKIDIITTGLSTSSAPVDMCFDNIRIYALDQSIGNTASNNFENDTVSMLPMQNGIRTGGRGERQWYYATDTLKKNYKLEAYTLTVEQDPLDPSNKVLKGKRGEGSNEYNYDGTARFTVNKPEKSLTIKFKALTGDGLFNIATDIADGTFKDIFYANTATTPADRIFTLSQNATGQFVSSGRYNGKFAADFNWTADTWNDVTIVYDVENNKTSFDINGVKFDVTPNNTLLADMMASDEDTVTVAFLQPYPKAESYIMLDDISIISDEDDQPSATEEPAEPTEEPAEPTEVPTAAPTAEPTPQPTEAPTAEPTLEPTLAPQEPAFEGEWKSSFYATGTGYNNALQYPSYVKDLGEVKTINKIALDHDSMSIMSFSLSVSADGVSYTPITSVYAGGVEKYSGNQIYRFAEQGVRYVKYSPVLLGEHTTQARVKSIVCSDTETVSMSFTDIADEVNPVEERKDIALSVNVTDSDGDTYTLSEDGVSYSANSSALGGNVLTINRDEAKGTITLQASDLSNSVKAEHTIKVRPHAALRNVGLYANAEGSENIAALSANSTVYLKAQALTSESLGNVNAQAVMALYNADNTLAGLSVTAMPITSKSAYEGVSAAYTLPQTVESGMYLKAYIWDDKYIPLTEQVIYSGNSNVAGFADAQLFIKKSETAPVRLSGVSENVVWESSDETVAQVNSNGTVTGIGDGTAVISAKSGNKTVAQTQVKVEPIYVFLCMGQSNMSAMTTSATEENEPFEVPVSEGVLLLNKQNEFEQARHSYGRHTGVVEAGGGTDAGELYMPDRINMTYSFAEDFKADHPGSQIGLIVNARVGSKIAVFLKNSDAGNGFANSVERATSTAVTEKGELKGILWHQGESNGGDVNYTYVFKNMMYDFRTELGNMELPIVAGGLAEDKPVSQTNTTAVNFNNNLNAETANIANFGFASSRYPYVLTVNATDSTNPNRAKDESHFSAKSQKEFGHRYYDAFMSVLNGDI